MIWVSHAKETLFAYLVLNANPDDRDCHLYVCGALRAYLVLTGNKSPEAFYNLCGEFRHFQDTDPAYAYEAVADE